MSTTRPIVKILLCDYDNCVLTDLYHDGNGFKLNLKNKSLSPHLVEIAKQEKYEGFIGVTHRCEYVMSTHGLGHYDNLVKFYSKYKYNPDYIEGVFLTAEITKNFNEISGIPNIAVSTLDDFSESATSLPQRCGYGFENILKTAEENLYKGNNDYKFTEKQKPVGHKEWLKYTLTKNQQLHDSISFAMQWYKQRKPNVNPIFEFHYFDDNVRLCEDITNMKLPDDVVLRSFEHCEKTQKIANPIAEVCAANISNSYLPQPLVAPQLKTSANSANVAHFFRVANPQIVATATAKDQKSYTVTR